MYLYYDCVQTGQGFSLERDMVGAGCEFGALRIEDRLESAALAEQVVHVTATGSVPAVLCAEASDPAAQQSLVKLVFQRSRPE